MRLLTQSQRRDNGTMARAQATVRRIDLQLIEERRRVAMESE